MYQLDGVDITAAQSGAAWVWPSTDIIEEVQVIGLGAPAEYGNYQGAVFNVITKSGSNKFLVNGNYYWQPAAVTNTNVKLESPDTGEMLGFNRDMYQDFSIMSGGPIMKDKLWYFGGLQYRWDRFSEPGTDPKFPKMSVRLSLLREGHLAAEQEQQDQRVPRVGRHGAPAADHHQRPVRGWAAKRWATTRCPTSRGHRSSTTGRPWM